MTKLLTILLVISGSQVPTVLAHELNEINIKYLENIKEFEKAKDPENIGSQMIINKDFSTNYKTNSDFNKQTKSGIPLGKYWMPEGQIINNELINSFYDYNPLTDKDAKYNIGSIPLQNRVVSATSNEFSDKTGNVRHHAMGVINRGTSGTPAQGSKDFDNYNFTNWAYVDEYAGWAGSVLEGIIILPTADIIDAAHINGTKILGMIYFDGYHGLKEEMIKNFLNQDEQGNYLIVDKLIEIADYYKFDGWYLNNEANAGGVKLSEDKLIEVVTQYNQKVKENSINQMMATYKDHAGLRWGGKIPDAYLKNSQSYIQDNGQGLASHTDKYIKDHNLEELRYNAFSYWNLNSEFKYGGANLGKYNFWKHTRVQDKENFRYSNSIGTFALADTWKDFTSSVSGQGIIKKLNINNKFYENDNVVFAGRDRNPSTINQQNNGIAGVIGERTTLTKPTFTTNFSTGQGINYFIDGENISPLSSWNHRGVMDIQPTYQWMVSNQNGNTLQAGFNYWNAFNKGNALSLAGKYNNNNNNNNNNNIGAQDGGIVKKDGKTIIDLFSSNILIDNQVLELTLDAYSDKVNLIDNDSIDVNIILEFETGKKTISPSKVSKNNFDWRTLSFDLSDYNDDFLNKISLEIKGNELVNNVFIDLGQLSLKDYKDSNIEFIDDIEFEYIITNNDLAAARIYWDKNLGKYDRYEIYQVTADNEYKLLGTTRTSAFYIEQADITDGLKLAIKAVSAYDSSDYKMTIREVNLNK